EEYFGRSEQLPTRIHLAADERVAAGLLLQRLPGVVTADTDAWNRLETLTATLKSAELLELDAPTLVRRLFHEEDVRLFEPDTFCYRCTCSRERTATMLHTLSEDELRQILDEQGAIHVDCEFCGHRYAFDSIDIAGLFAGFASDVSIVHH
ncbi:MAG: Hsp33 family molecular chaperone HslO, partial [Candidatus Competibacter sp.]